MSDDATVVWIAPARDDAQKAITGWADARSVRLTAAVDGGARGLVIDGSISERIERDLEKAKQATAALDADAADRALARAETTLREHPEIPHAAWLRAEVARAWAARFTRVDPKDEARARTEAQDADALDGGRVAGVGEATAPKRSTVTVSFVVKGGGDLVVRVDGAALDKKTTSGDTTTFTTEAIPAEHQVVAYVGGDPVFASWISIASKTSIDLHVGDRAACAASSLARAVVENGAVRAAGIACPSWVAALPGDKKGSVMVARCTNASCGPLLEWRTETFETKGPPQPLTHEKKWPTWATWALVGAGAAAAATITVIATGALESRPTETRFVAGGVRTE